MNVLACLPPGIAVYVDGTTVCDVCARVKRPKAWLQVARGLLHASNRKEETQTIGATLDVQLRGAIQR